MKRSPKRGYTEPGRIQIQIIHVCHLTPRRRNPHFNPLPETTRTWPLTYAQPPTCATCACTTTPYVCGAVRQNGSLLIAINPRPCAYVIEHKFEQTGWSVERVRLRFHRERGICVRFFFVCVCSCCSAFCAGYVCVLQLVLVRVGVSVCNSAHPVTEHRRRRRCRTALRLCAKARPGALHIGRQQPSHNRCCCAPRQPPPTPPTPPTPHAETIYRLRHTRPPK